MTAQSRGLLVGGLGVLAFSVMLPATRISVAELDSTFVGLGLVAAYLAAALFLWTGERLPERRLWGRISVVALGVVVGFPYFTALALRDLPSAHSAVVVGILPAATAVMAFLRAGERPSRGFWLAGAFGFLSVLAFAVVEGAGRPRPADGFALVAVALCAVGYAEGATLAREIGGWRVICWALLFAVVFALVRSGVAEGLSGGAGAWLGFCYVSVVSMFLGFFAWYGGLAAGGVARISQLQLAQPILTIVWSWTLLGEDVSRYTLLAALLVLGSVAISQRTRVREGATPKGAKAR